MGALLTIFEAYWRHVPHMSGHVDCACNTDDADDESPREANRHVGHRHAHEYDKRHETGERALDGAEEGSTLIHRDLGIPALAVPHRVEEADADAVAQRLGTDAVLDPAVMQPEGPRHRLHVPLQIHHNPYVQVMPRRTGAYQVHQRPVFTTQ